MANINKIKVGSSDPNSLMFDKYRIRTGNSGIFFGSLIPKDNSHAASQATSNSVWQVNDGWEVEIINSKKIAIKKFKIDTWGIRQIVPNDVKNNYNSLKVNVTGITRVHNEVICHTAGSNIPDGFTKAYGGNGGYNVYWYPGQFTSGNSMQGLVIQKSMGYSANNNERDDSLQIGKHPWDIGKRVCIVDGVATGTIGDWSYAAISIGLYGGVQNATSWHDETGDAYKQYDISDNPIYIDLNVEDTTKEIDVTSVECWDAYIANEKVYHKDKTLDNCWKKYGLAFPVNWNITKTNFKSNNYIEWISPTKFKIKGIPKGGISIATTVNTTTANYVKLNWKQFVAKLSQGLPSRTTVKIVRTFTNAYYNYDEGTHTWSNPVENIETILSIGDNIIPAFSNEIHKKDTDTNMSYSECKIIITSDTPVYDISCMIEIRPTFTDGEILTVTAEKWGLSKVNIPTITNLETCIDKLMFNISPANADFWTPIKEYYASHVLSGDGVYRKFRNAKNLDELAIILPNASFLAYDNTFKYASIAKLTFTGQENTNITSLNGIFEGLGNLKTLIINVNEKHYGNYLAGANDCSNMFNGCGLSTYPSNFICWNVFRNNAHIYSKPATHAMSMFWYSAIQTVPNYGDNPDADENTILCGSASGIFYNCVNLVTVGPIIDLQLVKPQNSENIFVGCTKLTTIRIRKLNHGDWHFDNTEFASGKKHGTLAALDVASIQYLFANLTNLNLYNSEKNIETINNSFAHWSSNYFTSGIFESAYNFKFISMQQFVAKLRTATQDNAPFIVHTTATGISMKITVSGLVTGDSLIFGATDNAETDFIITSNGSYTITKNDTIDKGFKLIGDSSNKTDVTVSVNKGWDLSIPTVQSANLYCPTEWEANITNEMVTAANAKNWTIYIGGIKKIV